MLDELERTAGDLVPIMVGNLSATGSVAEPSVELIPDEVPEFAENGSAVDLALGRVTGISKPFEVKLADLEWRSRSDDLDALKSLGASLRVMQINDIIVSPKTKGGKYVAIAGNRRCAAANLEGIPRIRARIYQGSASEIVSIVENAQRLEESPKSLLVRLHKALGGGADRKDIRELLGATGKAKSTISDLLYGALLDESRFQKVIDSDNVFKAIADLRKRKTATGPAPLFDPHAKPSDAVDAIQDHNGSVAERKGNLNAEGGPAPGTGVSRELHEATRTDDREVPASVRDETSSASSDLDQSDSVGVTNATPVEEPSLAADKMVQPTRPEEGTGLDGPIVESSVRETRDKDNSMIVEKCLQVSLAECALTDEEQAAAGDWAVALVRPAESRDVPVDINLLHKAIAELGRRC